MGVSLNEFTYLLDDAQELVNTELKQRFENGEISSPYEIFYEPTWLDVVQRFCYSLDYWRTDVPINQELRDLLCLIDIHDISAPVATKALRLISAYILHTESLHYWNRQGNGVHLKRLLRKFYGLNKPLNYDYLRYVINFDVRNENEKVAIVS